MSSLPGTANVLSTIQKVTAQVGRSQADVRLIAVTKSVSADKAHALLPYGVTHFAENRTDLLLEKKAALKDEAITWHLIGHLQRRKVKSIIAEIDYFHALDTLSLAAEIQKRAEKPLACFVEVNVSGEETKFGQSLDETTKFVEALAAYPMIHVVGLMTMAPKDADPKAIRKHFRLLKQKAQEIQAKNWQHAPCRELSMGMSQDYQIAIEEGATFVRVGRALFDQTI